MVDIIDVVGVEEVGDERAGDAGTVYELGEPSSRVLSNCGLGVIRRVSGLALVITRLSS